MIELLHIRILLIDYSHMLLKSSLIATDGSSLGGHAYLQVSNIFYNKNNMHFLV